MQDGAGADSEMDDGTGEMSEEPGYDEGYGEDTGEGYGEDTGGGGGEDIGGGLGDELDEGVSSGLGSTADVPVYSAPITHAVPKTGYYCVGGSCLSFKLSSY